MSETEAVSVESLAFGEVPHFGTLVVVRHAAYNRFKSFLQYGLEHLKREIQKLTKDDPGHAECERFKNNLAERALRPLVIAPPRAPDPPAVRQA